MGNIIGYTSNLTSHLVSNFTMNLTSNFPVINDYFGVIGGELDRKFTSDSLLLTAATFFVFAFCSLVSHSDFLFLMTCIASVGTMIVFWPTVGSLLNLESLLVCHNLLKLVFLEFLQYNDCIFQHSFSFLIYS